LEIEKIEFYSHAKKGFLQDGKGVQKAYREVFWKGGGREKFINSNGRGSYMRIALAAFQNESSWGMRSIAEFLRSKGLNVTLYFLEKYNTLANEAPDTTIDAFVEDFAPASNDIVGIGFTTPYLRSARRLAEKVSKEGGIIVVGGVHPTIAPEDCIPFADYIIRGMGEEAMLALTSLLSQNKAPQKGIFSQGKSEFWFTEDVTKFPHPRYGGFQDTIITNGKIKRTVKVPRRVGPLVRYQTFTSFGCPYSCAYCINPVLQKLSGRYGRKFIRRRRISEVISELRHVRERVDIISLEDEDFLTDPGWLAKFLEQYKKEINLPFSCLATPATFKGIKNLDECAQMLKDANCMLVMTGVQSASPRTSRLFNRFFDRNILLNAGEAFARKGIMVTYDIILENPFEDDADVAETVDTVLSLPRPFGVKVFYLTFFPKYPITEEAKRRGFKLSMEGDSKRNRQKISIENFVIQLAQYPFVPRGLLRFLYKKRSKSWARAAIRSLGRLIVPIPTSPIIWSVMVRMAISKPWLVYNYLRKRLSKV
jgi:anaerobic magnesium-protoporphyrin IX monomethyl ester cyclase